MCITLTESLYYLPKTVLAAIIFLALRNMIDTAPFKKLWRVSKTEWLQWVVAFVFTTFTGVTGGIFASIGLSLLVILKQASRPSSAVLGHLPGTDAYVPLKLYTQAVEHPGVKIFRFDSALTFANKVPRYQYIYLAIFTAR